MIKDKVDLERTIEEIDVLKSVIEIKEKDIFDFYERHPEELWRNDLD